MNTKRVFILAFALVVVVVAALSASMLLAGAAYNPHDGEKWRTDFSEARQVAQSDGTPILLYVWQDGCSGCEKFNSNLQNDEDLQTAVDRYVMVSANINDHPELAERYGVEVTPTVVVVAPDGEKVTSFNPLGVGDPSERLSSAHETATQ